MARVVTRHADRITGIRSGFDRLLFRGTLRWMCDVDGMATFLASQGVWLKDFGAYAERWSARVKTHAQALATEANRPFESLASSQIRKETHARMIAERDGSTAGLVGVRSCVEPCRSFTVRRNRARQPLELVTGERKCLHLYFYCLAADVGLMPVRLQTWRPFTIQVCVNGRTWLGCHLRREGIAPTAVGNCFTAIGDVARAQHLADDLVDWPWARWLRRLAHDVNPWLGDKTPLCRSYYWSVREREYATDVMFRTATTVTTISPALIRHAIEPFHSDDVLRFLGHRPIGFEREVQSDRRRRAEGVRVKHWVEEHSIKMDDKGRTLIRIETTIHNPDRFTVRRRRPSDGRLDGRPWRRGVADMRRRAAISRAAHARDLDALSVVGEPTPSHGRLDPVSQRVTHRGRPFRPLRPISPRMRRSSRPCSAANFAGAASRIGIFAVTSR